LHADLEIAAKESEMKSLARHLREQAAGIIDWFGFIKVKIPTLAAHLWEVLFGEQLRRSRRAGTVQLGLEVLEARIQLSSFVWTGEASQDPYSAQDTNNWRDSSTNLHPDNAPGAGDDVKFVGNTGLFTRENTDCFFDTSFAGQLKSITVTADYTSTIHSNRDVTVTSLAEIDGGTIFGDFILYILYFPQLSLIPTVRNR
jgi:hypothetical protein